MPLDSAVVVVDNGSFDRTADAAYVSKHKVPVYVLGCAEQGKGAAVRRGVLTSRATVIGFQDADLSTPLDALRPVLAALAEGAHVAIAVRSGDGALFSARTVSRRIGSLLFSAVARSLTGVEDSQCGFKFLQGDVAHAIFSRTRVDGFAFDVEVLAQARRSGLRIDEVAVNWRAAEGSAFHPLKDGVRSYLDVVRVRRALATPR